MVILEIKKFRVINTDEIYEKLCDDFNRISKELGKKYRLVVINELPKLILPFFLNFGDKLGECDLVYDSYLENFEFLQGIDKDIFIEELVKKQFKHQLIKKEDMLLIGRHKILSVRNVGLGKVVWV